MIRFKYKIKGGEENEKFIYRISKMFNMLFISDTLILKGFKEKEWEQIKGENNAIN